MKTRHVLENLMKEFDRREAYTDEVERQLRRLTRENADYREALSDLKKI